jgi:type II secretory pathway pseudopilin PulG
VRTRLQRGSTLIEAMAAMAVLMIGAAGLVGMQKQSTFFLADARRTTRATAIAQDLLNQIELWDYTDPRLANTNTANDADVGDSAGLFETQATPPFDHAEADLGAGWPGVPTSVLTANRMERYWNVSYSLDDFNGNGVPDAVRIAVIVRWQVGTSWRKFVMVSTKVNPADIR